jgi:hypothetical protein
VPSASSPTRHCISSLLPLTPSCPRNPIQSQNCATSSTKPYAPPPTHSLTSTLPYSSPSTSPTGTRKVPAPLASPSWTRGGSQDPRHRRRKAFSIPILHFGRTPTSFLYGPQGVRRQRGRALFSGDAQKATKTNMLAMLRHMFCYEEGEDVEMCCGSQRFHRLHQHLLLVVAIAIFGRPATQQPI